MDLTRAEPEALIDWLDGVRAVVACYSSGGGAQDRRAVFIDGTRRLLEACKSLSLDRFLFTSSTSALPDVDEHLDEDCEAWPESPRGRVQREAENRVREACERAGHPWCVLRLAGLYGPGRELGRLYLREPHAIQAGDGLRKTNLVHRDDAVAALLAALALSRDRSALVQVCDDEHPSRREMIDKLCDARGLLKPRWERPAAPGARVLGKSVDNRRLKSVLGVELKHPRRRLTD